MEKGFIVSLIFAAIVAIFALNNSDKVWIDLFFTEIEMSQAIIIFISALLGAIIVAIFGWVKSFKFNKEKKELNKRIDSLTNNNNELSILLQEKEKEIELLSKVNILETENIEIDDKN